MFSYCRSCGKPLSDSSETCPYCNAKRNTRKNMFCANCGEVTLNAKVVCPKCNNYLPFSVQKKKSRIVAGLLAVFFGALGVHKFYLGFYREGFILLAAYLIFGRMFHGAIGILIHLFAVIEGVLYFRLTDESFAESYVVNQTKWL